MARPLQRRLDYLLGHRGAQPKNSQPLSRRKLRPTFVGEFDGSALMTAFGEAGVGVFVAPTILEEEMRTRHGVVALGETQEVTAEYFAISVERRLTHPCVLAITQSARNRIFKL